MNISVAIALRSAVFDKDFDRLSVFVSCSSKKPQLARYFWYGNMWELSTVTASGLRLDGWYRGSLR